MEPKKYRVSIETSWELESKIHRKDLRSSLEVLAGKIINKKLIDSKDIKTVVRLNRVKSKLEKICLGVFDPEEIFPFINKEDRKFEYKVGDKSYFVRMDSPRYFVFKASRRCVACGILGTKMMLEYHPNDTTPHFNFYAEEGDGLVLMTKDHIQPKAYGGEDRHSNYQTMCAICNNLKGSTCFTLDAVRKLREIYNKNRNITSKKQMSEIMKEAKESMVIDIGKKVSNYRRRVMNADSKAKGLVLTRCDINVVFTPYGNYIGQSVYEKIDEKHTHVASIKKGTELIPLASSKNNILITLTAEDGFLINQNLLSIKND